MGSSPNKEIKNTCYITSSIEALLNLKEFINDVSSISEKNIESKNMKLTKEFKNMIKQKYKKRDSIIDQEQITEIKKILSDIDEKYKKNEQQDSNEFISILFNEMVKEVKGIGIKERDNNNILEDKMDREAYEKIENKFFKEKNSFLTNLFYGVLKKEIFCRNYHKNKVNFQIYNMIEIFNNENKDSIEELLRDYQKEKIVNIEFNCEICGNDNYCFLKTTIYYLPYYLIIYLYNPIKNNQKLKIEVNKFIEDKTKKMKFIN